MNPLLVSILRSFEEFEKGLLDIEKLQYNIWANTTAMESNIPKEIRDFLVQMDAELEILRFTVSDAEQHQTTVGLIEKGRNIISTYL